MHPLAGKPWVLSFKCLPLNMHHPHKHCSRSSTIALGNSTAQWQLPNLDLGGGECWERSAICRPRTAAHRTTNNILVPNTTEHPSRSRVNDLTSPSQVRSTVGPQWIGHVLGRPNRCFKCIGMTEFGAQDDALNSVHVPWGGDCHYCNWIYFVCKHFPADICL